MQKLMLAVLFAVMLPMGASADYTAFSVNAIPPGTSVASPDYAMAGLSAGSGQWIVEYVGTGTVTQLDRVTMPFCRFGGSNGGVVDLEIRSSTTTGPIVASSSLAVNSGNVWSTGCNVSFVNGTTSTWVLNQTIQYLSGVTLYFIWTPRGTTGTFYFSHYLNATIGEAPTFANTSTYFKPSTKYYMTSMTGYALGIPPVVYSASSSNVSCGTFDVGCYITTGLSFLFYPEDWTFEQLDTLQDQLASTSPFGYGYELVDTINNSLSVASSSFAITADLSEFAPQFEDATSVPIVSSEGIRAFAGDGWDLVQTLLAGGLILMLLSYFWFRFFHTI